MNAEEIIDEVELTPEELADLNITKILKQQKENGK